MRQYLPYLKWVFMLLGAMRFKMSGAFLGFFFGVFIEEYLSNNETVESSNNNAVQVSKFQLSLVILLANVINVNAYVSQQQSYFILKYFYRKFGTPTGKAMFRKLQDSLQMTDSYIESAKVLSAYKQEPKLQLFSFLFDVCTVDKPINQGEYQLLQNIAFYMQISNQDFVNIVQAPSKQQQRSVVQPRINYAKNYYAVLGVQESASADELKKAYRKLVLRYHPDTTKEDKTTAAKKFQEVQDAYDAIRNIKGIK